MHVKRPAAPPKVETVVFAAMLTIAAALIGFKVNQQIRIGPGWDTYSFLANAAEFAGKGFGYTELHRPPLLSLVTAGLFAAGFPLNEWVIQWVDGIVSLTGLVAFYLIARRRFEPLLAGAGALLLLAVQPLWQYVGVGYTDFFSVSLSMWLLWACIKATEDHPAWYLLAGPLFTASVMTRYTAILAAFPIAVWLLLRWRPFHQAKYLGGGVLLAIAAYVLPGARFYADRFGDILFPFLVAFGMYEDFSGPGGQTVTGPAAGWLLRSLPSFFGGEGIEFAAVVLLIVAALGITLGVLAHLQHHKPRLTRIALAVLACVPAVLAQIGGGLILRQVTIPIAIAGLWRALGPYEDGAAGRRVAASAALCAAMTAWLLAYFDFHGHERIEVSRYVITMAAPLVFLIIQGWQWFVADIQRTLSRTERPENTGAMGRFGRYAAPVGLALFLVLALSTAMASTASEPQDIATIAARETSEYLRAQPDIAQAHVLSELWPITAWYTRIPVKAMPRYDDEAAYQHALDKNEADYYVTIHRDSYRGYEVGRVTAGAWVLTRTAGAPAELRGVPYLGKSWDNYLEQVAGYTFYLTGDQGPQEWGQMAFLDALSAEELSAYDAVAVYGVRWHDRAGGEAALVEFVRQGGSVVIDASANLGKGQYDLEGTVMFDTVMQRASLPADAAIDVGPKLRAVDPGLASVDAAPFVDAAGGTWYGAHYTALPGASDLEILATAGGKPLVAMRRIGQGRVYWLGYNLVWHAFSTDNADEKRLVEAVFAEALSASD